MITKFCPKHTAMKDMGDGTFACGCHQRFTIQASDLKVIAFLASHKKEIQIRDAGPGWDKRPVITLGVDGYHSFYTLRGDAAEAMGLLLNEGQRSGTVGR